MLRALAFVLAGAALPAGAAQCYAVDSTRASVAYVVKQAGSPFRGTFRRFGGEICMEAGRVALIDVWLDPASVDSGIPEIDAALRDKAFFAVDQYPRIAYTSRTVQARADGQLAHGILQMKGKRGALDVLFQLQPSGGGLKVSGTLDLNRLAYGIGIGEWANTDWLSGDVGVEFQANLSGK